ncbi:MAG: hypothetical protein HY534_00200 [Chloroflexi bacterium]|nr:hypothetical protein [Chloroflexota bacterium]
MSQPDPPAFGPLHPVTRLGRARQQLRSFTGLHSAELGAVVQELRDAGLAEIAARLTAFRELHEQEAGLVIDELADIASDLASEPQSGSPPPPEPTVEGSTRDESDPAAKSPRRARWLAEQARRLEGVSRREFLLPWTKIP